MRVHFWVKADGVHVFYAIVPFMLGVVALVLVTCFSSTLSSLDQGIAQWAQQAAAQDGGGYPLDVGLISFINHHYMLQVLFPLALYVLLFPVNFFGLKMNTLGHLHFYLHPVVSFVVYYVVQTLTKSAMKAIFGRPRPLQTIQFAPPFGDILEECLQDYYPGYVVCHAPNPCGLELVSCPSGHTSNTASFHLGLLYLAIYDMIHTRGHLAQRGASKRLQAINGVLKGSAVLLSAMMAAVFIPTVMIARMVVLKHFFSDVVGGLAVAVMWFTIMFLGQPAPHTDRAREYDNVVQAERAILDGKGGEVC